MPYVLGIDIGNSTTAAAVARRRDATWARPEVVPLLGRSATMPSVLHLAMDGSLAVGQPDLVGADRAARGFVRRVGDDVSYLLDGEACPPHTLTAVLAAWVVEQVAGREGVAAEAVVLGHPASWGPYRRELLHQALAELGLPDVILLPHTITVAESHAARGFPGSTAAVYVLGGETFEAALVRRTPHGTYEAFGLPQHLEGIGGVDFDEALAEHVRRVLARELTTVGHPAADPVLRTLPAQCDRAKHELAVSTETDVLLTLPTGPARVPVSRVRFEDMIRPTVRTTVDLLVRAVHSAGLTPAQLDGVLLSGGSTRIPLITELLTATLGVQVEMEPDPQLTAANGAALAACQVVAPRPRPDPRPGREPDGKRRRAATSVTSGHPDQHPGVLGDPPPRPPIRIPPLELPRASRRMLARARGREG
ncbi:Hsp70 family protein [Micromonospora sp. NPDC050686]|uniref:Hsp70 family protein n=1 Tax=Micromonospora sp. NPDC050686 TaxID=3154631 RepID=UPI0033F83709